FEFDWSKHPGAQTPWTGQLLIVIDPDKGAGHGVGQERLPGDRRYLERACSMAHGIVIAQADLERLQELAGD
ncbi:lactate dehydrogenase, partial [Pseudomonas syringae pv. actinidiae]|nr:lactate dehydrogenase [Pseudomonas syringae pv. actinidiae]